MKKYFYSVLAASMLFACSQEEIVDVTKGEGQQVTFKVELPANVASRTVDGIVIGAGSQADQLIYAMYEHGVENAPVLVSGVETDGEDNDGTFTVTVPMAKDIKYDLLFLAYNPASSAFEIASTPDSTNLKALKFNAGQTPNVDAYDAFVGFLENNGVNDTKTVTLKRPFAQINAATTLKDLQDAETLGATVIKSNLVIEGVPTTYNVLSEEAAGSQKVIYGATPTPILVRDNVQPGEYSNETITVDNKEYYYLTLAYVLAGKNSSTHDATFEFLREGDQVVSTLNIPNLPIQRNYRTNVVGSLVTKQGNYTISIDAKFGGSNEINLWDGKTLKEPAYNETTKTYSIYNAAELAYIAALVNGTLDTDNVSREAVSANSLKGVTVSLMDDIYLNNEEWTPIGNGSNHFQGTLEGNNHTIYGLKVTHRGDDRAALFGTVSGTIAFRNIIFRDANIICPDFNDDFYGSALIGTAYGNVTIVNVDVVDSYISGNNKVGALLAHDGVVSSLTIDGCDVSKVKFEATNTEDGGSVGGFVGYFQGVAKGVQAAPYGEHYIKNSTVKNCVFNVVNSTNTGKRANGLFMGGLESKANQKLYITDCTAENNTWNEKFYVDGTEVTEGKFESPYYGLIGGERNDSPKGEVFINNVLVEILEPVAEGVGLNSKGEYVVTASEGLASLSSLIAADDNNFAGKTIMLGADVDLAEVKTNGDSFAPIGSTGERDSRNRLVCEPFKGTFDGQGHTIKNLYQSGWDMGYEWGQYGSIGLFAELEGATVKNVVLEGFEAQIEGGDISFVAGSATGDCVFEDITIKDGGIGTYNNGCGGIIGWSGAGTYTFKNITLGSDVVLGGLWGSFDSSIGGIVGQAEPGATYNFENVEINCRIDAYNDCTASYDYYNYRMCGMIIGRCEETTTINGANYPDLSKYNMTFNNVVVNYGDWMNYHYCEPTPGLNGGRGMRVEPGYAYDGLPADYDHSQCVDNHMNWIPFNQLIGGDQIAVKGLPEVDGVTVNYPESFYREQGYKVEGNTYSIYTGKGFKTIATTVLNDGSKNVTIELVNDIDLAGIEWPAVKTAAAFVLDGKGYSIKNLTTSAVEDHGFYSTAMFTSTRKATTIKNVVIENATVTGKGGDNSHGAVLVACNYAALDIEGVTVKNSTVSNCDRSSIITTYLYFTTATVKDCVVEDCTVNSIGTAGALLGMNNSHNFEMTGNTVKNTTISSSEGSNKAGILIGTWQDAGTLNESNNVVENSKAINAGTETNNNIGRHA